MKRTALVERTSTLGIMGALIRKDLLSLLPLVLLTVLVQVMDLAVERLDILPILAPFMPYVVWLASFALILSVFQLDAPASLVDDWLCRPVPKGALLAGKFTLILATLYGSRALATFVIDLHLGYGVQESLLEALLWQDATVFFMFPVFIMVAVVTTTLVQGMGALLALFVLIFVIPTPIVSASLPGPLDPAIGEAILVTGMGWMATAPAKLTLLVMLCLCLYAVFRRRDILLGRILLVAGAAAAVLLSILPMWLLPWAPVYGVQLGITGRAENEAPAAAANFSLHTEGACFPALPLEALNSDASYAAASRFMGIRPWTEQQLAAAGPGGVSFITRVLPRGLPRDWRAKALYVEASYADGAGGSVALRPALYVTDGNSGVSTQAFTHQWLLPQAELEQLAASGKTQLDLSYSLALLRPTFFELAADGVRRRLPGLGWCGATLEKLTNRIAVDCFSAFSRPALVSAELLDIEASRVDTTPPNYAPALLHAPTSQRIELELQSPSLLQEPMVKITAWNDAGMLRSSVQRGGILGDALDTCPLPSAAPTFTQLSSWSDDSPHRSSYIAVDENVQLEVLDWGGADTPLLLLPGLGATAHTWDAIAPKLAQDYRVVALSRRGTGGSSRPESGYDTPTLARDVVRVLDALDLERAVIVGRSIAGEEMTWLGAEHADRVAALIYLDAAYDRSREPPDDLPSYDGLLPPRPPPRPEDLRSYETLMHWFERTGSDPLPEGELIAAYNFGNRYLAGAPGFDMRLLQAVVAAIEEPRYRDIEVPALALYATKVTWEDDIRPWYDRNDATVMEAVRASFEFSARNQRESIEKFRAEAPGAEVLEFPGASHVIFLSHEAEVMAEIRRFIAERVETQ